MTETVDKDATGNRRSAARLVAVQALYEMDMVNAEVDAVLEEFLQKRWRQGDDEGDGDGSDNGDNASLTEPD